MVIHGYSRCAVPHELDDTGYRLSEIIKERRDAIPGQRDIGIELRKETCFISLLKLIILYTFVTDPQDSDAVDLHRVRLAVYRQQLCLDAFEKIVTENYVAPIFEVNPGQRYICRFRSDNRNVFAINDMADRRTIDWKVAAPDILASDALTYGEEILVLSVPDDDGVNRAFNIENLAWYWHNRPPFI